jgi:hypothetical protein
MQLIFRVYCANARYGEVLKVVGNIQELGMWNPTHAFTLLTSPDKFPFWNGGLCVDRSYINSWENIQFKYVLCDKDSVFWESHVPNRIIEVKSGVVNLCHVFDDNIDLSGLDQRPSNSTEIVSQNKQRFPER